MWLKAGVSESAIASGSNSSLYSYESRWETSTQAPDYRIRREDFPLADNAGHGNHSMAPHQTIGDVYPTPIPFIYWDGGYSSQVDSYGQQFSGYAQNQNTNHHGSHPSSLNGANWNSDGISGLSYGQTSNIWEGDRTRELDTMIMGHWHGSIWCTSCSV